MIANKKADFRKINHSTLESMCLRSIEATKTGMKVTDLALACGVHRHTVTRRFADLLQGR